MEFEHEKSWWYSFTKFAGYRIIFHPNSFQSFIHSDLANTLVDEHNQVFIVDWMMPGWTIQSLSCWNYYLY